MYKPKNVYGDVLSLENVVRQVGKGWHSLVEECYQICVDNELDITQVKEKYGTLQFYVSHGTSEIFDKIEDICARSANICEGCGKKGKIVDIHGWYYTLCQSCKEGGIP